MADLLGVDDTLNALISCICTVLEEEGRPTCECSTTIGAAAVAMCCECEPGKTGELWGSLVRVYRAGRVSSDPSTFPQRPCAPSDWAAEFSIDLARCFPTIDEHMELPPAEERAEAAQRLHADVSSLYRAINCCRDIQPPQIVSIDVSTDPSGGCSHLTATVRAPISLSAPKNVAP